MKIAFALVVRSWDAKALLRMLDQARERFFDVVIVEALDCPYRNVDDLAGIDERLSFLGIEIRAVHEGVVDTVLVGYPGNGGASQQHHVQDGSALSSSSVNRTGKSNSRWMRSRKVMAIPPFSDLGRRPLDAAEAIRDLVDTVTVFRDPTRPGRVAAEIAGRPNALLGESAYPNRATGVWGKMVAGEGLEPPTPGL
ncbi:hypothetical protein TM239_35540 [Bradyrhizobium sp. TM239]|nr:hypothetical protein TM239_35540 [Bradyrhizobium sp. TM239]